MAISSPSLSFQDIQRGLSSLSRNELVQIRAQCALLMGTKAQIPGQVSVGDEDWVLYGILAELQRRGLEPEAIHLKLSVTSYHGYVDGSAAVRELLEQAAPGLSAVEKRALGVVAGRELARFLENQRHTGVARDTMLNNVRSIPQALEVSFPGYMGARMLGVIIRGIEDGR